MSEREQRSAREIYTNLVALLEGMQRAESSAASLDLAEAFEAAQAAQVSTAGRAISLMSARFSRGTGPLSERVRQQQDALTLWRAVDQRLSELLLRPQQAT